MQHADRENLVAFGERIRKIREEKFSSLNRCAFEKGGITSATLSRIENGLVDFKFTTLLKLSYILEIPLEDLVKDFNFSCDID